MVRLLIMAWRLLAALGLGFRFAFRLGFGLGLCSLRHGLRLGFRLGLGFGLHLDERLGLEVYFSFHFKLGLRHFVRKFGHQIHRGIRTDLLQHLGKQRSLAQVHLGRRRLFMAVIVIAVAGSATDFLGG